MVQDRVFGRYGDLAAVFVTGVYAVLAVLIAGARTASAAPTPLASTYDRLVTDDGWKVELRASELVVNPMATIANNFASREGRVSARSRASAGCGTRGTSDDVRAPGIAPGRVRSSGPGAVSKSPADQIVSEHAR